MLTSELVAQTRKPTNQSQAGNHQTGNHQATISNFISFSNLNLVFSLSILVRVLFSVLHGDIPGAPLASVQACAMLLCLLFTNQPAMEKIMKHIRLIRGSSGEPDQGIAISQRRNNKTSRVEEDTKATSGVENSVNMAPPSSTCEAVSNREHDNVKLSERINHIMVAPAPDETKLSRT